MQAIDVNRDLVAELAQAVQGEVRFDGYSRMLYSTDASLYQIQPVGVVIPEHVRRMSVATVGDCGPLTACRSCRAAAAARWPVRPWVRPSCSTSPSTWTR